MKKLIFAIALISTILSTGAFAQRRDDRGNGRVTVGNGRSIVRIEIGDDRDDREILMRVRRLEEAVRDLQDQVYQLQSQPQRREIWVCSGEMFSIGSVIGKATTMGEAKVNAMNDCRRKNRGSDSIFCKQADLICEQTFE